MADKKLVIVESPTKANTIQKFLGPDYMVTSSRGHIRDLQESALSVDTEHGFAPQYVIPSDKKKVVKDLKAMCAKASEVLLASDEDREGEAISWHLAQALGLPVETTGRIVFHEITKDAIQHALANPRTINMNLVDAQQARRVLDRLVGFELSPVLWRKIQHNLSAGRVQSVALRLVVDREREILAFRREQYYRVGAVFSLPLAPQNMVTAYLDRQFPTIEQAEVFLMGAVGASYQVGSIEKKEANRFPAPPFTTSTLQQEASRKLRFPVNQTMRVAQELYERGLITYMRTDSTNLSRLALGTARDFILNNFGQEYHHMRQYHTHSKGAQEAHEAIRPTFISATTIQGTPHEVKLYDLIWKRTVASQMADAKIMRTEIHVSSDRFHESFVLPASEILFDGFLKVYMEGIDDAAPDSDELVLPALAEGDALACSEMRAEAKFTSAPPRYSEATLVKKLEELGIGRPSTYSPTITTLTKDRGYILRGNKEGETVLVRNLVMKDGVVSVKEKKEVLGAEKGKLLPQNIGIAVTDYLNRFFPAIMDYDFTANVEKDFDSIAEGLLPWNSVIEKFYGPFHAKVESVMADSEYGNVVREIGIDPRDGQMITARLGMYGPYVQKGEGDARQFANLAPNQLIEAVTLEEAIKAFALPRTLGQVDGVDLMVCSGRYGPYIKWSGKSISLPKGVDPFTITIDQAKTLLATPRIVGQWNGVDVIALDGKYGPYIKCGDHNKSLPKGEDPATVTLDKCIEILSSAQAGSTPIKTFKELDAEVIAGRFGPYIKHISGNFRIPKEVDPQTITAEQVADIIANTTPSSRSAHRAVKKGASTSKEEAGSTGKGRMTKKK